MLTSDETPESPEEFAPDEKWWRARASAWVAAGVIGHEIADAIVTVERQRAAADDRSYRRLITIVATFGAVLLGAGLILLVSSNWADLSRPSKVGVAVGTVLLFEATGFHLRYRADHPRTGHALLLVGAAAYGGAIFLVAQTYHYPVDDPRLFLAWFVPTLASGYLVDSRAITALGIAIGYGALHYESVDWIGLLDWDFRPLAWTTMYLAVGVAVLSIGLLHERARSAAHIGRPYLSIGVVTLLALTYFAGFRWLYEDAEVGWARLVPPGLWIVFVVAVVTAGLTGLSLLRQAKSQVGAFATAIGAAMLAIVTLVVRPFEASLAMFVVMNVAFLLVVAGLVILGLASGKGFIVNWSIGFFGIAVITRYIEIGAGMLGTSVGMMLGGVLLLAVGFGLERFRRALLARAALGGAA